MTKSVNIDAAKDAIKKAVAKIEEGWKPTGEYQPLKDVLLGDHLTYRYILFTGIVAKNVDTSINPLTLQKGSELEGAYDARSVCHKAVVPMERAIMGGRLGESNEPFLNKPARFKELSKDNAVRKGRDQKLLFSSIEALSSLNGDNASEMLNLAVFYIFQRPSRDVDDLLSDGDTSLIAIHNFIDQTVSVSDEGQSAVVCVGAALTLMAKSFNENMTVKVHPVNQAGSSSKEIGDIDVEVNGKAVFTVEVKDKEFTSDDVDHAVKKAVQGGLKSLYFVMGPQVMKGKTVMPHMQHVKQKWAKKGVTVMFLTVIGMIKFCMTARGDEGFGDYLTTCLEVCKVARVKDETFRRILHNAEKVQQNS